MRRFELKDAKSNKFWEIQAEGASVTTHWGRIGTAGQTKTKELASPDKASTEMAKQIASKLAKGYQEVTAAAAPVVVRRPAPKKPTPKDPAPRQVAQSAEPQSPAARSEAAPGAPTPIGLPDEHELKIPPSWLDRLHPRRSSTYQVRPPVPPTWEQVRAEVTKEGFPEAEPQDVPVEKLVELGLVAEPERKYPYNWKQGATLYLHWVLAHRGLTEAIEVALALECMQPEVRFPIPDFRPLRVALANASDAVREAAIAQLEGPARTNPTKQALAFYLLPEETAWDFAEGSDVPARFFKGWVVSITDPDRAIGERYYAFANDIEETVLVEHGDRAIPYLKHRAEIDYDAEQRKKMARLLARIPSDAAASALMDLAEANRSILTVVPTLFERFPRRTLRLALSRPQLALMTKMWVIERPEVADAVVAEAPELAGAIEALRDSGDATLSEAEPGDLPLFFREPPWDRQRTKLRSIQAAPAAPEGVEVHLTREELAWVETLIARGERSKAREYWSDTDSALPIVVWRDQGFPTSGEVAQKVLDKDSWWLAREDRRDRALALLSLAPEPAEQLILQMSWSLGVLSAVPAVASAAIAERLLAGIGKKTIRPISLAWMERHPKFASKACLHFALARSSKIRATAQRCLGILAERGHGELIRALAKEAGHEVAEAVETILGREAIEYLPNKIPGVPSFAHPGLLPRPRLKGGVRALGPRQIETLIRALAISTIEEPYAGTDVAKEILDPGSLAEFAWALFELWLGVGADPKHNWTVTALGLVGNDTVAHRLAPLVRQWPGESQHARAVMGLDALLAIGTEVALMHLDGIAQRVKFKGIKTAANERIEALAEQLGLTRDELADRLVPKLDLEPDGSFELNYGPRKFRVGFDEALRPFVEDEGGRRLKSLPKPGAKDDPELAPAASERFKSLQKAVKTVGSLQVRRLESAMSVGRRWPVADYRRFIVEHPLLVQLARRLVWVWESDDAAPRTFRVTEDSSFADSEDDSWMLPASGRVGIAHPVDIPVQTLAKWRQLFDDYELLQPFEQLRRRFHRLTPEEREAELSRRHGGTLFPHVRALGLISSGWERGTPQDGGASFWMSQPLADGKHEVRIWLGDAGLWSGMASEQTEQPSISAVSVVKRGCAWNEEGEMPLGAVPASLMSEVLDALERLVGRN